MISVDPGSPISPVEQIRSQLAAQIRAGELAADTRLPPVRQLAADLRVAPGSVAKAYRELEGAGLIRTARAAGTRVNPGQATAESLVAAAEQLARAARREGLSLSEAQGLLAHAWPQPQPQPRPQSAERSGSASTRGAGPDEAGTAASPGEAGTAASPGAASIA